MAFILEIVIKALCVGFAVETFERNLKFVEQSFYRLCFPCLYRDLYGNFTSSGGLHFFKKVINFVIIHI